MSNEKIEIEIKTGDDVGETENVEALVEATVENTDVIADKANETVALAANIAEKIAGKDELAGLVMELLGVARVNSDKLDDVITRLADLSLTTQITEAKVDGVFDEVEDVAQDVANVEIVVEETADTEVEKTDELKEELEPEMRAKRKRNWI